MRAKVELYTPSGSVALKVECDHEARFWRLMLRITGMKPTTIDMKPGPLESCNGPLSMGAVQKSESSSKVCQS